MVAFVTAMAIQTVLLVRFQSILMKDEVIFQSFKCNTVDPGNKENYIILFRQVSVHKHLSDKDLKRFKCYATFSEEQTTIWERKNSPRQAILKNN